MGSEPELKYVTSMLRSVLRAASSTRRHSLQVLTDQTGCFLASQIRTFGISPLPFPVLLRSIPSATLSAKFRRYSNRLKRLNLLALSSGMSRQEPQPLAGNTLPECSHLGDLGRVVLC